MSGCDGHKEKEPGEADAVAGVNRPTDFHRVFLFSGMRGTVRGGGEGRAQGGVILKETGDRRGGARTDSASARRPLRSRDAANADQRQMWPSDFRRVMLYTGMRGGQRVAAARVVPKEA